MINIFLSGLFRPPSVWLALKSVLMGNLQLNLNMNWRNYFSFTSRSKMERRNEGNMSIQKWIQRHNIQRRESEEAQLLPVYRQRGNENCNSFKYSEYICIEKQVILKTRVCRHFVYWPCERRHWPMPIISKYANISPMNQQTN